MSPVVLHQFRYSHFNDKVRWALAYKKVECVRRSYLPGPHIPAISKLSGQRQTPVLQVNEQVIAGSAAIIDYLEARFPEPPLYPKQSRQRASALQWQQRVDNELGPATRSVLFAVLVNEADYLCHLFSVGKPALKARLYRTTFPLARPLFKRANKVANSADVSAAAQCVQNYCDEIGAAVKATGYLVGDKFSIADLAAAALIAPLCDPACEDMYRPHPRPASFAQLLDRWRDHPAISWAERMYAEHRPDP